MNFYIIFSQEKILRNFRKLKLSTSLLVYFVFVNDNFYKQNPSCACHLLFAHSSNIQNLKLRFFHFIITSDDQHQSSVKKQIECSINSTINDHSNIAHKQRKANLNKTKQNKTKRRENVERAKQSTVTSIYRFHSIANNTIVMM